MRVTRVQGETAMHVRWTTFTIHGLEQSYGRKQTLDQTVHLPAMFFQGGLDNLTLEDPEKGDRHENGDPTLKN